MLSSVLVKLRTSLTSYRLLVEKYHVSNYDHNLMASVTRQQDKGIRNLWKLGKEWLTLLPSYHNLCSTALGLGLGVGFRLGFL